MPPNWGHFFTMTRKICIYCGKRKNKKSFPKHIKYKDKLDTRCKSCIKRESKLVNKLRKKAPVKSVSCDICNKNKSLCLDHCRKTKKFRGWLCTECNTGLGKLGDNIDGIVRTLNYLLKYK